MARKAPREPPRFGGGWARSTPTNDLTPEELQLRQGLQKSAPAVAPRPSADRRNSQQTNQPGTLSRAPQSEAGQAHSGRASSANAFSNWDCSCGYTNHRESKECRSCQKSAPPSKPNLQSMSTSARDIQQRDKILDKHIATARAAKPKVFGDVDSKPTRKDESGFAQSWKHIMRRSDEKMPSTTETKDSTEPNASIQPGTSTASDNTKRSLLELEMLARLEQTKNGRYIELNADRRFRKVSVQLRNQEGDGAARQNATERFTFGNKKGSWSRWTPSTVEDDPAAAPAREEYQSTTRVQSNGASVNSEAIDAEKYTGGEANGQPSASLHTEKFSSNEERAEGRWASWTSPPFENRSISGSGPDDSRATAEEQSISGHIDAASQRAPTEYTAKEYPEQSERRESRRTKKKSRDIKDEPKEDPIDEFQLARRSFKAEATPYARGMNRERARKKQRTWDSEYEEDEEDRIASKLERRQQRKREKETHKRTAPPTPIYLPEFISVANLAAVLRVRVEDFVRRMEAMGFEETSNDHVLDAEVAGLIAAEFNFEPIFDHGTMEDLKARPPAEDKSLLPPRPPVVTIMGHVDHGKTTLLDWLRKSSVAASEFGGITQHIGAFSVQMPSGKIITFLDTPGHAAFLSMRQRGANVTDIVILVVAADDSVKPQTVEAIKHAQAAKVPIIVAVNKIDKEDADVERVKLDLARYGVEIEDYGGDTQVVRVSGKTGQGMGELEDAAVALADILDMRAEIDGQAEGWVLEATTKKAGRVATVLVRRGTLRQGEVIVAGTTWARVRSLKNEAGVQIPSAGPGTAVEIDGWREQPTAGDEVLQATDEQQAKSVVDLRLEDLERTQMAADMTAVNEARRFEQEKREAHEKAEEDAKNAAPEDAATAATSQKDQQRQEKQPTGAKELPLLIKADVSGSAEAVLASVSALGSQEVRPNILRSAVGPISEFDIEHAAAACGHIIAFNVATEPSIRRFAEQLGVRVLEENIIYRLVDDVKGVLSEMLPPLVTQRVLGEAEVAQVFEINVRGRVMVPVAGCRVRNGVVSKNAKVRVLRGKEIIYDGM